MTTDEFVRDALADLAPLAPADDAAFAGVRRAVTRRRRRRTAGRVAAVVLAAGVLTGGVLATAGQRNDEAGITTRPPTERVSFGELTFELPEGWEVIRVDGSDGPAIESMCVGPAGNPYPRYDDCSGLELYHGDPLPGHELDEYRDHGPWGWYHETDVSPCPDRPYDAGEPLNGIVPGDDGYEPIAQDERSIGGRAAVYDQWAAGCERSDFRFYPRAWHVADAQILIVDVVGRPEIDSIIDSVRWTD
jgi:hypothetical protein